MSESLRVSGMYWCVCAMDILGKVRFSTTFIYRQL